MCSSPSPPSCLTLHSPQMSLSRSALAAGCGAGQSYRGAAEQHIMQACLSAETHCSCLDLQHSQFAPTLRPLLIAAAFSRCLPTFWHISRAPFRQQHLALLCICSGTELTAMLPCCCSVLQRLLRRNPLAAMSLHKPVSRAPSQALLGTIPYGLQPVGKSLRTRYKQAPKSRPASCKAGLLWHACRSCQFLVHAVVSSPDASLQSAPSEAAQ